LQAVCLQITKQYVTTKFVGMIGTVCLLMLLFVWMIPYWVTLDVDHSVSAPGMSPCRRLSGRIAPHELGTVMHAWPLARCSALGQKKTRKYSSTSYATPPQVGIGLEPIRPPSNEKRDPKRTNGSRYGYIGLFQVNKNNWQYVSKFE